MKRRILGGLVALVMGTFGFGQVAINTSGANPDPDAILDIQSTDKGVLIPRMTASERDQIGNGSPAVGMLVFVTDDNQFYYYDGSEWLPFGKNDGDWQVNGDDMYSIPSGAVGVGTDQFADNAKMHIKGGYLWVEDAEGDNNGRLRIGSVWHGTGIYADDQDGDGEVDFVDNLFLAAFGDVYVGHPVPDQPEQWDHANLIVNNGNIGVGTADPTTNVDMDGGITVNGTGYTQLQLMKNGTSGLAVNVGLNQAGDVNFFDYASGGWVRSITLNTGKVGIDTLAPEAKLHVVLKAGDQNVRFERNENTSIGASLSGRRSRGTPDNKTALQEEDVITGINAWGYDGNQYVSSAYMRMFVDAAVGDNDVPARIEFATRKQGEAEPKVRMVIKNNGLVGIGTAAPDAKVHMVLTDEKNVRIERIGDGTSGGSLAGWRARGTPDSKEAVQENDVITALIAKGYDGSAYVASGRFRFFVDGPVSANNVPSRIVFSTTPVGGVVTDQAVIKNNGDVGIGTLDPTDKLHVVGNVRIDGNRLKITQFDGTGNFWINDGSESGGFFAFKREDNGSGGYDYQVYTGDLVSLVAFPRAVLSVGRNDDPHQINVNFGGTSHALTLPNNNANDVGRAIANGWDTYSDARIKTNVRTISSGLEIVKNLRPVKYFHHNSKLIVDEKTRQITGIEVLPEGKERYGFIAQELYKVVPEMVHKPQDETKELWTVDYMALIPILVKAIQEQQKEIEALKAQLNQN
ncbi:MAG: tail fiber domain-containing protein [Chlorobi bacterium]|nr:tail fiber domain-containing protein [Chlorobiota bacterium]